MATYVTDGKGNAYERRYSGGSYSDHYVGSTSQYKTVSGNPDANTSKKPSTSTRSSSGSQSGTYKSDGSFVPSSSGRSTSSSRSSSSSSSGSVRKSPLSYEERYKAYKDAVERNAWSNSDDVRQLQEEWWNQYVNDGVLNDGIHQLAENIRKSINPRYEGDIDGPNTRSDADSYIPKELLRYAQAPQQLFQGFMPMEEVATSGGGGFWIIGILFAFLLLRK